MCWRLRAPRARARWLPGIKLTVRSLLPNKSVRITWQDGTPVELFLVSKGAQKTTVQVQHRKLPDRASAERTKAQWTERLDSLGTVLAS